MELLVVVGLTVLLMSLFTVIFQMATRAVSVQRGIAKNDQKTRTMVTLIRKDLENRTFRNLVPFAAVEPSVGGTVPNDPLRRGYFYVSENDPADDTDDVLAFTIEISQDDIDDRIADPFYGKADPLGVPEFASPWAANTDYAAGDWVRPSTGNGFVYRANAAGTSGGTEPTWLTSGNTPDGTAPNDFEWVASNRQRNREQPEWDDGIGGNNTGASRFAEVVIFMRDGKLFRRVMLIREGDTQPTDTVPGDFFSGAYTPIYDGNFWSDFDYSAFFNETSGQVGFNLSDSLQNNEPNPLGHSRNRFGFDHFTGQPKEYLDPGAGDNFIGRYTQEETSHPEFLYPQAPTNVDVDSGGTTEYPMQRSTDQLTLNANGVVTQFAGGNRRGEDMLMDNVLAFNVELLDPVIRTFVNLGDPAIPAGAALSNANNRHKSEADPALAIIYGPRNTVANNNIFDTWHPHYDLDDADGNADPSNGVDPAPFNFTQPLPGIRLTIQYIDPETRQIRELSIVQSLLDN